MRKFKKFIALLMTVMMFISMLPMDALAEIIAGGGNASEGQQFPFALLSVVPDEDEYVTFEFYVDGTKVDTQIINKTKGETVTEPKQPAEAVGQKFLGWFVGETPFSFGAVDASSSYSDTVRVDAKFEVVFYVFFLDESGRVITTKEGANGASISTADVTIPLSSTTKGLTGWYYDEDLNQRVDGSVTIDGANITLYPKVEDGHWLTFNSDGGTYHAPKFYLPSVATVDPGETTKLGYTFAGWYNGGTRFTFGNTLGDNVTLKAHWTARNDTKYTVIHWQENANDDGYSFKESETKTGTTGATTNATAKRTNSGDYQGFTAQTITQGTIAGDGSTIVNVYYTRNVYDVKFYTDYSWGSWSENTDLRITAKYGAEISDKWPTYNGSSTWSTTGQRDYGELSGPYQVNINTMPLGGASFYGPKTAQGSETAYYYVEVLPGESGTIHNGVKYKEHHHDTSPGTGYTVTKEDKYPITGFTYKEGTRNGASYNKAKFYYTRNSYKIVFMNNGTTDKTVEKKYEQDISNVSYTPTAPAGKEGYEFGGWYDNELCEGTAYEFTRTMPAQNITVHAKWVEPVVEGKAYVKMAGGKYETIEVTYGKTIDPDTLPTPQKPEGEGWVFVGWATKDKDGNYTPFNFNTVIYADSELYPYYINSNKFSVVYDLNGGNGTKPDDGKKYASGADADIAPFPAGATAPDGKVFVSWNTKTDGSGVTKYPGDKIKVEGDITLYAQYAPVQGTVSVTYHSNFGTPEETVTYTELKNNDQITVKSYADTGLTARAGYTFQGWSTTPDGNVEFKADDSARVNKEGSNDLYAVWTANEQTYTVEFYYQNKANPETYDLRESRTDTRTAKTDDHVQVNTEDENPQDASYVYEYREGFTVEEGDIPATGTLVLKLYFKLNTASYTINYLLEGNNTKVHESETVDNVTVGSEVTLPAAKILPSDQLDEGYKDATYSYVSSNEITIDVDSSKNVFNVYYTLAKLIVSDGTWVYDGETHEVKVIEKLTGQEQGYVIAPAGYDVEFSEDGKTWTSELPQATYVSHNRSVFVRATSGNRQPLTATVKLTIEPRPMKIQINSDEKRYNGQRQNVVKNGMEYTIVSGALEGHNPVVEDVLYGEGAEQHTDGQINAGTYVADCKRDDNNNPLVKIIMQNGNIDVTNNFAITVNAGKLEIKKRSVTLTSGSGEKVYDGQPLTNSNVTVGGDGFVGNDGATWNVTGTITNVGKVGNEFTYTLDDGTNQDNYIITPVKGELEVTPVTAEVVVTISGGTATKTYDGKEHIVKGYEIDSIQIDGKDSTLYTVDDFKFTGSAEVNGTNAKTYPMGLKESDFQNISKNFTNVKFIVTDGWLVINKRLVKVTAEPLEYAYDYENPVAHPADDVARYTVEAANGDRGLLAGDALNADVLYDGQSTQTLIGVYAAVAQIAGAKITNSTKGDVTANYAIEKEDSTLTITGDSPLDPKKETTSVQTNYTVGDVIEYKITVKNVSKNEATNVVVTDSMAEIQDSAGYTVSEDRHTATIASIPAGGTVLVYARHTVTAEDVENAYAGDASGSLTNVANIKFGDWNKDVEGDDDELNDTYEYVVRYYWNNYTSVQPYEEKKLTARVGTEVTEEPAAIEGYTPVSADSRQLIISADQSKNVIEFYYYKNVELTANSETYTYDGTEKQVSGLTIKGENKDQDDQLIAADFSAITVGAKGTDAGEYPANFAENTVGTVDKTGRYIVTAANNGKLVINPVTGQLITITANSASKIYDGTPLMDNGFTFTQGVLADGDVLTAVVEGSATNVGDEGKNVVKSYVVKRGETDVTKNYTFGNSVDGKLTINPRKVTLKSADLSKTYDGTPLVNGETALETEDGFVSGEGATYTFTGSQTVVGSSANAFTYTLNEGTKAGNYEFAKTDGTLTVTQNEKAITVTANSHTWEYDGQPHSDGGYTVTYGEESYTLKAGESATLSTGDKVTATVKGSVTNVADSADDNNVVTNVTITNEAGTVVNDQYKTITRVNGGLKITRRGDSEDEDKKVKITAADNTVEYDGSAHGAKLNAAGQIELGTSYTTVRLVEGHYVDETTLDITGSQTNVGVYLGELKPAVKAGKTEIVIRDGNNNNADVTKNYKLTLVNGTLTITGDKLIPDKKAEDENIESNYKRGDKIEFTITVKNVSNEEVQNVIVTDSTAEIQEASDGSYTVSADKQKATIAKIAANSEIKIKALHTVTSEDILAGKVGNVANVEWKDGETTVTKTVDDDTTKLTPPDVTLNVTKTSDWEGKATGAKLELGTKITYTITVKNTGNVPYTNVNFTDLLQNGDATVTGEIPTYGTLAVNEEKSFTVEYIVTEADLLKESINNKVTAEADEIEYTYYEGEIEKTGKATPKSNEAQVTDKTTKATVSTSSTKTTTSTPKNGERYALGETITYDIVVTNDGNLTVTDIEVVDNLEGAEIVTGGGYKIVNGVAVIDKLEPGQSVTVKAKYEVKEKDILADEVLNSATVTGKGPDDKPIDPDTPESEEDPTDEPKATLNIVKTVENKHEDGTPYGVDDKIAYKLTVSVGADNNVTVKDIMVADTLLTAEYVENGIVEIKGNYKLQDGAIKLPNMAPNADPVVIEYTYTVQASDLGKNGEYGSVHNAATAKGTTKDPELDPTDEKDVDTPTKIKLVITANDNLKVPYDGQPHGGNGYTDTGVASGHEITGVTISGSEINAGVYEGKLEPSGAVIKAGEKDVTSHYEITYVPGTLEIVKRGGEGVTLNVNGYNGEYDAAAHSVSNETVTGAVEGTVWKYQYRKSESDSWSDTKPMFTDVTEATVYVKASNANYEDLKTSATVTITQKPIEVYAEATRTYNGADQTLEITAAGQQTGKTVVSGETLTLNGAKITGKNAGEYVVLDGGNDNYTWNVKKADGTTDSTGNYTISVTGKLTIGKASLWVEVAGGDGVTVYDSTEQIFPKIQKIEYERDGQSITPPDATAGNSYIVVSGLQGEDRLIESTLHYRLVGTHANYDVTGTTMLTGEGKIYGKFFNGNDASETAYVNGGTNKPTVVNGSTSNPTDVSENYIFTYVAGELKIKQRPVTIMGNSDTLPYNGKEQSVTGWTVSTTDGSLGLAANDTIAKSFTHVAKGTTVGEYDGQFSHDKANVPFAADSVCNGKDYAITLVEGKLTIKPLEVEITAQSANKVYDGTALTNGEYTENGVVDGHQFKVTMTAESTITNVGTESNVIATVDGVKVTTGEATVIGNYKVTTNNGTLTIKPCPLTITVNDSKEYDGKLLDTAYDKSGAVTTDNLVTGDSLTAGKIETKNGYVGTYVYNTDPKVTESTITEAFETKNGIGNYDVTIVSTQEITGNPVEPVKEESSKPQETNYKLGEKIEFTITVKNISKEDLTGFEVVDATAEIVNDVVKGISVDPSDPRKATITETLEPGEQIELTAIHTVDENDILNARAGYKNIAKIQVNGETVFAEKTIEEIDHPRYDFTVEKKLLADDQHVDDNGNVIKPFELGDTAYFTITIVNTGNMTQTINLREDGSKINGQVPTFVDTGAGIVSEGASSANITLEPGKSVAVTAKIDITEEVLAWRSEPDNKASNIVWAEGAVGECEGVPTTKRAEAELPLPALHKLTIKYVLENGNPIPIDPASAWKYEIELRAGEKYSRLSPVLNNLETDTPLVEGVMPDHDLEITVIYTGNGGGGGDNPGGGGEEEPKKENERDTTIRIRDYETPLGLSNVFMNAGDCFE